MPKRISWLENKRLALQIALGMQVSMNAETIYGVLEKGERCLHRTIFILDIHSRNVKLLCLTIEVFCFLTGNIYETVSLEILRQQVKSWRKMSEVLKKQFP